MEKGKLPWTCLGSGLIKYQYKESRSKNKAARAVLPPLQPRRGGGRDAFRQVSKASIPSTSPSEDVAEYALLATFFLAPFTALFMVYFTE
jgi:hypothetical protein